MAALPLNLPGSSVSDGTGLYNTALHAGLASNELLNNAFNTFNKVGQQIGDKNVADAWIQAIATGKSPDEAMALASRAGNSFTSADALNKLYSQNLSQRQENRLAAKEERDIKDWQDTIAAAKYNRANEIAMSNLDRKAYQANADAVLAADPGIQRYITLGDMTGAVDKHQQSQAETNYKNTATAIAAAKEAREIEDRENAMAASPYNNELLIANSLIDQGRFEEATNIIRTLPPSIQRYIKVPDFMDSKNKSLESQAKVNGLNATGQKTQLDLQKTLMANQYKKFLSLTNDRDVALAKTAAVYGMTTTMVQDLLGDTETGKDINKSVTERTLEERAAANFKDKGSPKDYRELDQNTVLNVVAGTNPNSVNKDQQNVIQAANDAETNRLVDMFPGLSKDLVTKMINSKSKEEFEANKNEVKQDLLRKVQSGGDIASFRYSSFYDGLKKLEFNSKLNRVGTKDTENNIINNYKDFYSSGIKKGDSSLENTFNNKNQAEYVAYYKNLLDEYVHLRDKGIRGELTLKEQARLNDILPLLQKGNGEYKTYIQGMKNETEFLAKANDLVKDLAGVDSISFESLGKFLNEDTLKNADKDAKEKFAKALNATMQEVADELKEQHADGINTNLHQNDQVIKVALAMLIQENPKAVTDPTGFWGSTFKYFSAKDIIEKANILKGAISDGSLSDAAKRKNQLQLMSDSVNKRQELNSY